MTLDELKKLADPAEAMNAGASEAVAEWVREMRTALGRPPLCAEIGTWCGLTAVGMALAGARVLCVDPFTGADGQTAGRVGKFGGSTLGRFLANAWAANVGGSVLPLVGRSPEVAGLLPDETFDFVFIDGEQGGIEAEADVLAWAPNVRPGGVLGGHDVGQAEVAAAVVRAVTALGWPGLQTSGLPDQLWRVDKP